MNQAKCCSEYINVEFACTIEGDSIIEVRCPNYETFSGLPSVLEFEGRLHGRTGWNSDRGLACYKTSAPIAKIVA
jgi:hypothetical protein